ncbi:SMP-30/gluconolactonase/LRE family protein [Bosea thiooxidans]
MSKLSPQIDCVIAGRNRLGESPVWSVREGKLYWVDSRGPAVFRWDPATAATESVAMPQIIGSIGLRRKGAGQLVIAMQNGLHGLDFDTGALTFLTDPEADQPENRFNDGRCDRHGRFWSGTMNDTRRDPTGALYRFDGDGRCTKMRDDIIVPNSVCWSPDDTVMYFADTYREIILTYRFHADEGAISDPRPFVETRGQKGRPDGSTVDIEGFLWNAEFGGGRVVRYTPDGRIDRVIAMPVSQPSSCVFGGPDLDILYVTSATQRLTEADLEAQPLAGSLFAVDVGVRGLPEPDYAG